MRERVRKERGLDRHDNIKIIMRVVTDIYSVVFRME